MTRIGETGGSPVLILDEAQSSSNAKKRLSTGNTYIDDPLLICDYLGQRFDGVRPHPRD